MKTDDSSLVVSRIISLLYPFIIVLGFYVILMGHRTPGVGFQGGAILSAVFITRYMVLPLNDIRVELLHRMEKLLFAAIIFFPVIYLFTQYNLLYPQFNEYYLITMNALIGVKVCCGLSIIFFRFVFYESR